MKEIPLKQWLMDTGEREGVTPLAIWKRVFKYKTMKQPRLKRVNCRRVYVLEP